MMAGIIGRSNRFSISRLSALARLYCRNITAGNGSRRRHANLPTSLLKLTFPSRRIFSAAGRFISSFRYYSGSADCSAEVLEGGKKVCVTWPVGQGGRKSTYHAAWLSEFCACPECYDSVAVHYSWTKHFDPRGTTVAETKVIGGLEDGHLEVLWKFAVEGEEHRGTLPLKWLQKYCYSQETLRRKKEAARPTIAESLPVVSYSEVMQSEEKLWQWLKAVNVYGICLVTDAPAEPGIGVELTEIAGGTMETVFEKVYNMVVLPEAINRSYSTLSLPPHQDLQFYESPPGLQVLFCVKNDAEGGENMIVDMWAVAERLRKDHPKYFKTLTTSRATFQQDRSGTETGINIHIRSRQPHIVLDEYGEIASIHWAKQAFGPLQIPTEDVDDYYEACYTFRNYVENSPQNTLYHKLKPGEALTYNNRRMAHGRTEFKEIGGTRHLQGSYVNIDHFMSRVNTLGAVYEPDFHPKRVFRNYENDFL